MSIRARVSTSTARISDHASTVSEPADDWRPSASWSTLKHRAALLADLRRFFDDRGLVEIDAPVITRRVIPERHLQPIKTASGDCLVGSPEAPLKRILAATGDDIYSLGHVFRADEAGGWHNPEFCMLEWYRCRAGMQDAINETAAILECTLGTSEIEQQRFIDVFKAGVGVDPLEAATSTLAEAAHDYGVAPPDATAVSDRATWIDCLMSLVVQPQLGFDRPLCLTGFPSNEDVLVAPANDGLTGQRFEIYYRGVELANGAEELIDSDVARQRMQQNAADDAVDERLLAAMRSGLPTCAGVALGVDRLLALQLGHNDIASVMPFDWSRR